jgi:hypothetical protein
MYALNSSEAKRQYPKRFEIFLNFLSLSRELNEKTLQFYQRAKLDLQ